MPKSGDPSHESQQESRRLQPAEPQSLNPERTLSEELEDEFHRLGATSDTLEILKEVL